MKKSFNAKSRFSRILARFAFCGMVVVGLTGLIFSGTAFADTSLTLSPMSQTIILIPGETYSGTVKVLNGSASTEPMTYEATIGSYNPVRNGSKDDYGASDLTTRSNQNIVMDWMNIDKPTGTLQPNEVAVVKYTIKVPEDAPAGVQYASILVADATPVENTSKGGANIESRMQLGTIIYANVAGETIEKGYISENSMPTILMNNKLEATSMVRNEGNIYTGAKYTLQVWPMFSDEEICTNEESADNTLVLPNTDRYHVQTCDLPMVGIFKAKQVVSIFGEESVLEKTILVCPLWLMFVVVFITAAIIVWIIIRIRVRKKSQDE